MQIKHLPHEIKEAFKLIKEIKGYKSNNTAVGYCIAVAATHLKTAILADMANSKELQSKEEPTDG